MRISYPIPDGLSTMYELQARQKIKKRIFSRPVFAILLFLALITFKAAWNMHGRWVEAGENLTNVTESVEKLKMRELELSAQIARLETDRGVEEEIRKKYSVVKPGEEMVVVVDGPAAEADTLIERPGIFRRSWDAVKGWFSDDEGSQDSEQAEVTDE